MVVEDVYPAPGLHSSAGGGAGRERERQSKKPASPWAPGPGLTLQERDEDREPEPRLSPYLLPANSSIMPRSLCGNSLPPTPPWRPGQGWFNPSHHGQPPAAPTAGPGPAARPSSPRGACAGPPSSRAPPPDVSPGNLGNRVSNHVTEITNRRDVYCGTVPEFGQ